MDANNNQLNSTLLTRKELAEILRCTEDFLYKHRTEIKPMKIGRKVLYEQDEIIKFLEEQKATRK